MLLPPMGADDVYFYADASGAILLERGDGTGESMVTLAEAMSIAAEVDAAGAMVWVAGDHAPLAVDTLTALGRTEAYLEPFVPDAAPRVWIDGSTPLMEAITDGRIDLVRDLIDRHTDIHQPDDDGFTALHHAAVAGDHDAIDALLAAGANPEVRSRHDDRPVDLARAWGNLATARWLAGVPDDPSGLDTTIRLGSDHLFFERLHLAIAAMAVVAGIGLAFARPVAGLVAAVTIGGLGFVAGPGTGGILRARTAERLDGTDLWVRHQYGRPHRIDLTRVTAAEWTANRLWGTTAEAEAAPTRQLLLAHPDGRPISRLTRKRLRLDETTHRRLAGDDGRIIIVSAPANVAAEIGLPVGGYLESRGVPLLAGYRGFLRRMRWSTGFIGRRPPHAVRLVPDGQPVVDEATGEPTPSLHEQDGDVSIDIPGDGITAAYLTIASLVGSLMAGLVLLVFLGRVESTPTALLALLPLFVLFGFSVLALPAALAGAPRRLIGTDLVSARPFRRSRTIDLTEATAIAATTVRWVPGNRFHPATWTWTLILLHPDGEPLDATRLVSMGASVDEVPRWDPVGTRAILVPVTDSTGARLTRRIAMIVRNHGGDVYRSIDRAITDVEVDLGILHDEPDRPA